MDHDASLDAACPSDVRHFTALDADYPTRLRRLARPPATLSVRGGSLEALVVVAIVGSREALALSTDFATSLARRVASAGGVVVSGGALGVDAAAHHGALAAGRTWVVAGTGCQHCFPLEHRELYDAVGRGPGAMVWPFDPSTEVRAGLFVARNRVLVGLADVVVVVQAGAASGALNAAGHARRQGRPLWVVPPAPWFDGTFDGSRLLLDQGARPLHHVDRFLAAVGLGAALEPRPDTPPATLRPLTPGETAVLGGVSSTPRHLDEIAARAHLPAAAVQALLLTLALEDVVVEAPPGFFRRHGVP